ncbi:hypothetical protein BD414DRAFT_537151 [Trametes punicea]|nr:hypothetical protein BD414DRAFT_537151 [Trametes punicea]
MATDGTNANSTNTPTSDQSPLLWEGDRMFNIYIYDYCMKRGFHKTANELMVEAAIPPQSQPPINAKQGLLFEWWSVFWVLFTAKSTGTGPEDALLYTQHQAATQNASQKPNRTGPPPPRYANGARPPTQNGPQINGIGPHGPQPQSATMPNGAPHAVSFPGNASQANGVPGSSAGPPGGAPPPPQAHVAHMVPGQRPPQQRGVNGGQFQSPTMAHSSPNMQGGPQQGNPAGGMGPIGTNPPLTQMRGNMLPPSGPTGPMGNPQHTPQPAYQQLVGRSPSNPGSPASAMTARSPSLAHRQPPTVEMLNAEINRMPPPTLQKIKQDMGLGDKDVASFTPEEKQQLVNLFRRSNSMKPPNMPGPSAGPSSQPGPSPMQYPAGLRTPQMTPNAQPQGQQPLQPPQGQSQQQRGAKRNSTSPGQEAEQLPRNESSPPDRKRARRSPGGEQAQQPPMTPMIPPPQPGGPPMQPHMQPNGLMRSTMQMPQFPGAPMAAMGNPMMGPPLGTPQMSPMNAAMNQAMMGGAPPGAMNNAQMQQYRQAMQNIHKPPQMQQQMHPGSIASPSGSGPQGQGDGADQQRPGMQYMPGGPPPGNRMGQNKPMSGMRPPPSPAMSAKQPGGPPKPDGADGSGANGHLDRSPQNAAAHTGGQQQQQQQQQPSQQQQPQPGQLPQQGGPGGPPPAGTPAPPTPNTSAMTAPSPQALMGTSTSSMNHPPPPPPPPSATDGIDPSTFGGIDFDAGLEGFDSGIDNSLFGAESSINFERDFAAWFDPENANGA